MTSIKYYYAPGSCSLATHILLRDVGVDFEAVRVDAMTEEFRIFNPKMRVPVLVVGDEVITELPAIAAMISTLAPNRNLMGRTTMETIRIHEWMNWLAGTVHPLAFKMVFRPLKFTSDPAGGDAISSKAREYAVECLGILESKLNGVYAVGGAFTVVEPYLFVYRWGNKVGLDMHKDYPKFTALIRNLVERPSVQETLKVEGVESTIT